MERLDSFMARANAAYYANNDPFADFTTAPEIAQMFGELLGAWAAVVWQAMGAPDPVLLVEAGPGRGTLMADALRAVARVAPAFRAACRVHFVEISARLAAVQARVVPDAVWHGALADVPAGPAIVLANEFLDALPIRQFERRGGAWFERHVQEGRFVLVPSVRQGEAPEGAVAEENALCVAWMRALSRPVGGPGWRGAHPGLRKRGTGIWRYVAGAAERQAGGPAGRSGPGGSDGACRFCCSGRGGGGGGGSLPWANRTGCVPARARSGRAHGQAGSGQSRPGGGVARGG